MMSKCEEIKANRHAVYGDFKVNFKNIAKMWSAILNAEVSDEQVALMMAAFKIVRASVSRHEDNYIDCKNYIDFAEELNRE